MASALLLPGFHTSAEEPVEKTGKKGNAQTFGIDISHYVGTVDWDRLESGKGPIEFVFMRSTMGSTHSDENFCQNWQKAGEKGVVRGAYHYYRPQENSARQFRNYARHVTLAKGDFPPILDIEKHSPYGVENLRRGILNWLRLAEEHFGVKPVIYTGAKFYEEVLHGHVQGYILWIASYNPDIRMEYIDWSFHQYTNRLRVGGVREYVDGNHFRGSVDQLKALCIP